MISKLVLGTVQFGLDYGINNTRGKISFAESKTILQMAAKDGIDMLDTASAYGDSEEIIGNITHGKLPFKIVTKVGDVQSEYFHTRLRQSLSRLKCDRLYGCLIHDIDVLTRTPTLWNKLLEAQEQGLIIKRGVSVYHPDELIALIDEGKVPDIVQVPYNVFDRRFEPLFPLLKHKGIEIHVRSVFLQGLLLSATEQLKPRFDPIKNKITRLKELADRSGVSRVALLMQFALQVQQIDRVVIGVDGLSHYFENVEAVRSKKKDHDLLRASLLELQEHNEDIILPSNWK
ncbi:MAG: aldo/keto reductase [Bacteroidota bacterium]